MQKGKDICKALKEVRQQIADANNIRYQPCECHHKGDCSGTCPACEQEIRYIESQLKERSHKGINTKLIGIAASICATMMPLTVSAQDSKCNTTPASVVHKVSQGNLQVIDWSQGRRDAVVIKIQIIASDNKRPVTSVDVRLLGTDKHTSTDLDGYFAVKVPINGTLRVSRFGVETKVLKVRSLLKLKKKIIELEMDRYIVGEIAAPSSERISDSDSPTSHVEKNK
jgi:ragA protein